MGNNSRIKKSMQTAVAGIVYQIIVLFCSFIGRTVFIHTLGSEYLGVNGLFSNILTILSLAELGFGTAINFCLYKPLADNDEKKIAALMNYYKKIYNTIAAIVFVIGLSLTPFLEYLVKGNSDIPHIQFYYILILMRTAVSYCFVYKMALFNANQQGYLVTNYGIFTYVLQFLLQNIFLITTHDFSLYLLASIICTLLNNILISCKADRTYPFVNSNEQLTRSEKKDIFRSVKSLFVYRIGGVLLNGTDNILISVIVGVSSVGIYSNYLMVINSVKGFITILFRSVQASIGNLSVSESREKQLNLFNVMDFVAFVLYGGCTICFWALLNEFILVWIGSKYLFNDIIVAIIVMNFYIPGTLEITTMYRDAIGLFNKTKYVYLCTSLLNLVFSLVLGRLFGLAGILSGTIIARLLTNFVYEPYVLFNNHFKCSCKKYFVRQVLQLIFIFLNTFFIKGVFSFMGEGIFWLFAKFVFTGLWLVVIFWLLYHKTAEYLYIMDVVLMPKLNNIKRFVFRK